MLPNFVSYTSEGYKILKGEATCEEIVLLSLRLGGQSYGSCGWEHQTEELSPHSLLLSGLIVIQGASSALICLTQTFQRWGNPFQQISVKPVCSTVWCQSHREDCAMERHYLCEVN